MSHGRRASWHLRGIAAALLTACVTVTPAVAGKADNSIRFAHEQTLQNLDPYFNTLASGNIVADHVWDTLIYRDPETGEYEGDLATTWRWIDDRTLELDLRRGVRFHNGAEFTADDVVYTLSFVSNPESGARQDLVRWIGRVEKVDAYKVRIVTRSVFPAAVGYLAIPKFVIHPHEHYAKVGTKGVNQQPIGTGPFRVIEHSLGKHVRLERNPDYFKGSPKAQPRIDKLEIRFIPDAQTRVAETVAGGLDLIMNVARDQANQLRDVPGLQIASGDTINYAYLMMNTLASTPAPPLRDIRVRWAIMHAIDRESMITYLMGSGARLLHAECHPSQFGCTDAGAPRYDYDPAKARQLLAEAGYPNGFDLHLHTYRDRNQTEAIIGYLSAVGIRARLRFMEAAAVRTAVRSGRLALGFMNWASNAADVSNAASAFHEFSSDDMNRDPEVRDLLVKGDTAMDPDARKEAYAEALSLIAERAYTLPFYSLPTYYIAIKDLDIRLPADATYPRFYEMSYR